MPIVPEFQIGLWSGWWFSVVFMAGGACDMSQCHHCPLGGSCATDAPAILIMGRRVGAGPCACPGCENRYLGNHEGCPYVWISK